MAYCRNCGNEISDHAIACKHCGEKQANETSQRQTYQTQAVNDTGGAGWGLLGFCIPVAGLILFLVWNTERPNTARAAGLGALISVIVGVVFYVIFFLAVLLTA